LTDWARRYEHGEGVPKSVDRAIRLYCKAAKAGHAEAQYFLGYIYAHGRGVKRDDALAAAWFGAAAKNGDRHARNMLKVVRTKPRPQTQCLLSDGLPVGAERKKGSRHPAKGPIADLVRNLAPHYRLDPDLVLAVVEVESNFDPRARSHKNAQGLMQLIPATAERFGVDDVWDPEQNLRGGMSYLRWLLDHFDGDIKLALAGYNAGEQAVRRHRGIPPYAETRAYVERISRRLNL
jgi:soluble lytic murein transglycosylase-like protein